MAVDEVKSDYSLPPSLAEVARRELNETPAARTECLIQFRRRLSRNAILYRTSNGSEDDDSSPEFSGSSVEDNDDVPDDAILLRFLRSKKFDVQRSCAMYENYIQFFRDHPQLSSVLRESPTASEAVRHVWEAGVVGGLRERDARGRSVLVTFPGRWNPAKHSLEDVLLALVLQLEFMITSEETQVRGFVLVADFTDFSLHQMRSLKPWYIQTLSTLMQNAFPARFKGVYIINQPWYMSVPLSIIRPFLSEKIKTRVNILGRDRRSLQRHFKPETLPQEFGGTSGTYRGQNWTDLMVQQHSENNLLCYITRPLQD